MIHTRENLYALGI